jgi:hypothetical protein
MLKFEFIFSRDWSIVTQEQEEYEADNHNDDDESGEHKQNVTGSSFCHLLLQYYLRSSHFYEQIITEVQLSRSV